MKKHLQTKTALQAGVNVYPMDNCLRVEERNHPDFWQNLLYYQQRVCNGCMETCTNWENIERGFLGIAP